MDLSKEGRSKRREYVASKLESFGRSFLKSDKHYKSSGSASRPASSISGGVMRQTKTKGLDYESERKDVWVIKRR